MTGRVTLAGAVAGVVTCSFGWMGHAIYDANWAKGGPAPAAPFTQAQVVAMDAACTAAGGVLTVGDAHVRGGVTLDRVEQMLCAKRAPEALSADAAGTLPVSNGWPECRGQGEYPTSNGECHRPGTTRQVTSEGRPSYNAADCHAVLNTTWLECRGAITGEVYYYGPGE